MTDIFQREEGFVIPSNGVEITNEGKTSLVRVNIVAKEMPEDSENGHSVQQYECELYRINNPVTYASIVSAVVRDKYSADAVEAILLNHGDGNEEHNEEFDALQEWRKYAKEVAHKVINK